jgi:hypothetical protein
MHRWILTGEFRWCVPSLAGEGDYYVQNVAEICMHEKQMLIKPV